MGIDTVNDLPRRVQYTASAAQTMFDYPFPIFTDADLVVYVDDVLQALNTDYSVTGETDDLGGIITLATPASGGEIVTIFSDLAIERVVDYQQNGPWSSQNTNDELDQLTLICRELKDKIGRCIRWPLTATQTSSGLELSPLSSWYGKFLRVSSAGILEAADLISSVVAISQSVISALLNPQTTAETTAAITPLFNGYSPNDGYDVRRAGVVGNGVADDTTALINACKAAGPYARVYLDSSLNCLISASIVNSTLAAYAVGQTWYGGGKITTANGFDHHVFDCTGITDFTVTGLRGVSGTLGASYSSATARFFRAVSSSHRCRVLYCHVTGFQSAVQFNASTDCIAAYNYILNPYGWGINVQTDADYAQVLFNRILGTVNEHGIYFAGSSGNAILMPRVQGNIVSGSAIDGIKNSYCDDSSIIDNRSFSNGGQGFYLTTGCNRCDVHDNVASTNGENGILVFDSTTTSDRNRLHRNTVRKNDKNGISISSSGSGAVSRTIVEGNDVEDNDQEATGTQYGIVVSGATTTTKTKIHGNRITDEPIGINVASGIDAEIGENFYENCAVSLSDTATTTKITQRTRGATSVADGGTITHGHPKTPTAAIVTASTSGEFVSVTALGATTITVAIKKHDNGAGTTQIVYWEVSG